MSVWDYDDVDPFWAHMAREANEALHDREVGYSGAIQASKDLEEAKRHLPPDYDK